MKARSLLVLKSWQRFKFSKKVKVQGQDGAIQKNLSQGIYMCNICWFESHGQGYFFKRRSKFKVKRSKIMVPSGKVLSQGICMCNMKVLSRMVFDLWSKLKFFYSGINTNQTPTLRLWHKLPVHWSPLAKNWWPQLCCEYHDLRQLLVNS